MNGSGSFEIEELMVNEMERLKDSSINDRSRQSINGPCLQERRKQWEKPSSNIFNEVQDYQEE